MADAWEWLVPLPPQGLGQNARVHEIKRSTITRGYRVEVAQIIRESGYGPGLPLMRARVGLTMRVSRTRPRARKGEAMPPGYMRWQGRYRPTDTDNLDSACKPLLDALGTRTYSLADCAGVIADDHARHLERIPTTFEQVDDWRAEGVLIRLERLP